MTVNLEMLLCGKCGEEKPPEDFALDRSRPNGRNAYCRSCRSAWAREHRRANPTYDHRRRLLSRYGITEQQYEAMLEAQGRRCAICRTDQPGGNGGRTFHVDHDHETGAVRALLCSGCNSGLARFGDDPALLRAAAAYLEVHRG